MGGLGGCSVSEFVEYYPNEPSTSVDSVVWFLAARNTARCSNCPNMPEGTETQLPEQPRFQTDIT